MPGSFGLGVGGLNVTIPNALTITGSGIQINYNPEFDPSKAPSNPSLGAMHGSDGLYHQKYLTISSATVSLPEFGVSAGVQPDTSAGLPGLTIWDNGFTIGTAFVTVSGSNGQPLTLGSILSFNNLTVSVKDFDVVFGQAINFNGSVSISTTGATFLPGKPVSASVSSTTAGQPAASATLQFSGGKVQSISFSVDTFSISVTSFVTFVGHKISIDTGASATQPLVTIGSVGAQIKLGSVLLSGQAQDFEFLGNGSFVPLKGFGVVLGVGTATGSSFMWPSWLPIQITQIGIQWPNGIQDDPADILLTLSASVTGIQGLGGLTFSGSVTGIQVDVGMLLKGEFPIVGIQSFGVSVAGNMFGGKLSASLLGGILKLDANGNMIAATDTTTTVVDRVFFLGLQGGFNFAGMSGFTIQMALSSLGPLGVQISVNLPEGILIDPDTGLSINNFTAGVKFFTSLPSITDPMQLNQPAFNVQATPILSDWQNQIQAQVVAQYKAIKTNPSLGGFLAAFTAPMTIIGSATIYSIYTSQQLFNGQVNVEFSTDGKFLVEGKLNFADNNLSISGKLYADLSKVASGSVTVLFLANIPDQVQLLTIDGSLRMGFENASGQQVTFKTTVPASAQPSAVLVGPRSNGNIGAGTINGEGTVDVTFPSNPYASTDPHFGSFSGTLNPSSVTVTSPPIQVSDGGMALDTTKVPLQISAFTYRFWLTGVTDANTASFVPSDVSFVQGRVSYTDGSGNVVFNQYGVDAASPPAATVLPSSPTVATLYHAAAVDVRLYPSVEAQFSTANLTSLVGQGGSTVQIAGPNSANYTPFQATLLGDGVTLEYEILIPAGTPFAAGQYTVTILPNKWSDSLSTSPNNLGASYSFSVVNVVAQVAGPFVTDTNLAVVPSTSVGALGQSTFFTVPSGYTQAGQTLPYIDVNFLPAPGRRSTTTRSSARSPGAVPRPPAHRPQRPRSPPSSRVRRACRQRSASPPCQSPSPRRPTRRGRCWSPPRSPGRSPTRCPTTPRWPRAASTTSAT